MEELRDEFRPEFLNRIDETIVFQPLSTRADRPIVEIQLGRLRKLLADRKIGLELTPARAQQLADEGYDPIYGARPLKRVIQQRLQNPLALKLLQGEFRDGDTIMIDAVDGDFSFEKHVAEQAI